MDVSHIVSLYTKRNIIPHTLRSIMRQEGGLERELILVDDNSRDDTVEVARQATSGFATKIITNSDNKGPSVRLNQGAKQSTAKYLHFLDHDDILPANATQIMYDLLEKTGADFVYGRWERTNKTPEELLGAKADENFNYSVSDKPLDVILAGKFRRMCLLVKREVFEQAGGFDEEVFIQDESLPIRLAAVAKNIVTTDAVVNLVPKGEGNLSENKTQLNHDRFLAYYNFYKTHPLLPVYKKIIAAAWKQRRDMGFGRFLTWQFRMYLKSQTATRVSKNNIEKVREYFAGFTNVKRP